jgi:hypothetical protein
VIDGAVVGTGVVKLILDQVPLVVIEHCEAIVKALAVERVEEFSGAGARQTIVSTRKRARLTP